MRVLLDGSSFWVGMTILVMMGLAAKALLKAIGRGIINLFKKKAR